MIGHLWSRFDIVNTVDLVAGKARHQINGTAAAVAGSIKELQPVLRPGGEAGDGLADGAVALDEADAALVWNLGGSVVKRPAGLVDAGAAGPQVDRPIVRPGRIEI